MKNGASKIYSSKSMKILFSTIIFSTFSIIQLANAENIVAEQRYIIEIDNQSSGDIMVQPREFLCVEENSQSQTVPKGTKKTISISASNALASSEKCNTSSAKFNVGLAKDGNVMGDLTFINTTKDNGNKNPKEALAKHNVTYNPSQIKQDKEGLFAVASAMNTIYVDLTKDENTISEKFIKESAGSPSGDQEYHAHIIVH